MSTKKCLCCEYWKSGIPVGNCLHPDGNYQWTTNKMVLLDATDDCPIFSREIKEMKLTKEIE